MSEADQIAISPRDQLLRLTATAAILGLGAIAYRAVLEYDPTATDLNLQAADAAFFSPSGNHPLFVYTIAGWIAFRRRGRLFAAFGRPAPIFSGAVLLGSAAIVCAWAYYVQAPDLAVVSLVLTFLGLAWWLGGREVFRAALLPSLVLLALVPFPAVLANALVFKLQITTSTASVEFLSAIGLDTAQAMDRFSFGGRSFQVIESCSGIRSTQTLFLTAILIQDLFYRSRLQSVLLVASAPLLGFFVNQVRVLTLVFNPRSELASVHEAQGLLMLVVGILLLTGFDALLSRWLPAAPRPASLAKNAVGLQRLALAIAALAVIAATSFVEPSENIEHELDWDPHDIPLRISNWRSQPLLLDREYLGSVRFSRDASRRFKNGDETIDVFAGVSERGRRSSSPVSPKILLLGSGRPSTAEVPFAMASGAPDATAATLATEDGLRRVVRWNKNIGTLRSETFRALIALDRGPGRRPGLPQVFRLSTPIAGPRDIADADARLRAFGANLLDEIEILEARTRENQRLRAERS